MTTDKIAGEAGNKPTPQPMLSNLAKCQQCASPMTVADGNGERPPRYACPNNASRNDHACDSPEIDVRQLDELIINRVVADVFTNDMLEEVGVLVRKHAERQALLEQRHLDSLHGEIERLDIAQARLAAEAQQDQTTCTTQRLNQLAEERRTIQDEARQSEHALQGYRHVANDGDERISTYARSPETYLRDTNAAATKSILELVVREVLVSADSVTVAYTAEHQPVSNKPRRGPITATDR